MLTVDLLRILTDKKPRSVKQLAAESGHPKDRVYHSIVCLLRAGYAKSEPVKYRITATGVERSKFRPVSVSEQNRRAYLRLKERREAQRAAEKAAREQADAFAASICKSGVPNSVFSLGDRPCA